MTKCASCGKKIGFFEKRYDYLDEDDNTIKCCKKCNDDWIIDNNKKELEKKEKLILEQKEKLKKELEKKEKLILEQKEKLKKEEKLLKKYCKKYLSSKDFYFKRDIIDSYNLFNLLSTFSLDGLKKRIIELLENYKRKPIKNSKDYDYLMSLERASSNGLIFIEDIKKLNKLLANKNIEFANINGAISSFSDKHTIEANYRKIFEVMVETIHADDQKSINLITSPIYKKISKITKTDKKRIIKEYLKMNCSEDIEIISNLLKKFGFSLNDYEIKNILNKCKEEIELEEFEKNLGLKPKKAIGDFTNLDGHQFEDYLKELFSILGYQVIKTKQSGDQGADLIIKKDGEKKVVQAKKYSGNVTNKAIQEVVASKEHYDSDSAMVVTTGMFTKSAIELAKSNKVEIWDKYKLKETIDKINKS